MIGEAEAELGRAARAYLTYTKTRLPPPPETRAAMERMREDQDNERDLEQPIESLARHLLPGPYAPDGAVANQITALNEDSLQISGEMWFLGDQASWTEPMQFMVELQASTSVVQAWTLSVGNAATGFRPVLTGRERRRGWMTPTEWLFVIKGPDTP